MKNIGTRVFAAALAIWYSLSVIGFGVHTCSSSNRSFLTTFISGVSCEDVHPVDKCGKACCEKKSHQHVCKSCCNQSPHVVQAASEHVPSDGPMLSQTKCCYDDYQQIIVTGSGQNNGAKNFMMPLCLGVYADISSISLDSLSYSKEILARALPDAMVSMAKLRPLLSIWRI